MAPAWNLFFLSGAAVVLAGIRLACDGDAIAERTGIGSAWIGAVLVAGATSLPESMTDFFAIRPGHVGLAIAVTAVAAAGILTDGGLALFGLGWAPLVAAASHLGGMRLLCANRREPPFASAQAASAGRDTVKPERRDLLRPALGFAVSALAILVAAHFLACSAAEIADQLGVATGVVGIALWP